MPDNTSAAGSDSLVVGPRYYRSFAAYRIPFRPTEPVPFAGTEGLWGFCSAYHDEANRVVRFDKILLVYRSDEERTIPLAAPPGTTAYFAPMATGDAPGEQIEYAETEKFADFFKGTVGPSGSECRVKPCRWQVQFSDLYSYWPNGKMRSRTKRSPEKPTTVEYFREDGTASPLPALADPLDETKTSAEVQFGKGVAPAVEASHNG